MKSLIAFVITVVTTLFAVLLYFKLRKSEARTADWQTVLGLPGRLRGYVKALFSAKPAASEAASAPVAASAA